MESNQAIGAFAALAQESRLAVFRLLVRAGDDGMPAGDIARALDIPANTLSTHLAVLVRAGLAMATREGRVIRYAVDFAGVRAVVAFLLEDCCQGSPQACGPLLDAALPACC